MSQALLSSAYFGPIQWYQKLYRYDRVRVEAYDNFIKQTYRNRCVIATTGGVQALTVPVDRNRCTIAGPDGELALSIPTVKPDTLKCPKGYTYFRSR